MACVIASNKPLRRLQAFLGIEESCHSRLRPEGCIHGLLPQSGLAASMGGAVGSCQALFRLQGDPSEHTERVRDMLGRAGMVWPKSHEIFWGYKPPTMTPADYIASATKPLLETGRVPIIITSFDAGENVEEIDQVMKVDPGVPEGEVLLMRILLKSEGSLVAGTNLIQRLLCQAQETGQMPKWWPVFQGALSPDTWERFQEIVGVEYWRYVNIAVNPLVQSSTIALLAEQITVVQVPIGKAEGMGTDGTICIPKEMPLTGSTNSMSYNLFGYFEQITKLEIAPTVVLLGPTLPGWTDEIDVERVARAAGLLKVALGNILWDDVPSNRRRELISLEA